MDCKNVLIIDDDPAIRQVMQDVLEIKGYTVFTAVNGHDGIEKLQSILPEPCVILLDLMMPKSNGWQFLDIHNNHLIYSKIPVIICTAFQEAAKGIKANGLIKKPFGLDELVTQVERFCS